MAFSFNSPVDTTLWEFFELAKGKRQKAKWQTFQCTVYRQLRLPIANWHLPLAICLFFTIRLLKILSLLPWLIS